MYTIIITGATSGIGFAVCKTLAAGPFRVIGIGRTEQTARTAEKQLKQEFPLAHIHFLAADLMQQREVNRLGTELSKLLESEADSKLHALINNAGAVRSWYATTEDGFEQQFALNHLAGFLLTHHLFPYLRNSCGRIIMTSSDSHQGIKINWNDIMFQKGYNPLRVYQQSKLCNLLFAFALNARYRSSGIRAYGIDPGLVRTDIGNKKTGRLVNFVWNLRKARGVPAEVPAKTYAFLCKPDSQPQGFYYKNCREHPFSRQVTFENAERLFHLSETWCGIKPAEFGQFNLAADIMEVK